MLFNLHIMSLKRCSSHGNHKENKHIQRKMRKKEISTDQVDKERVAYT